jgi:hypothetical protein
MTEKQDEEMIKYNLGEDGTLKPLDPNTEETFAHKIISDIKIESSLNKDDNLPFGYYNPATGGKLVWICNYDQERKITSVFVFDNNGTKERKISYLADEKEAKYFRDELVKEGWRVLEQPKIEFHYPSRPGMPDTKKDHLSRKDIRRMKKNIKTQSKLRNPYQQ